MNIIIKNMNNVIVILKLMRINQWIKNGFVVIPFVLSLKFLEVNFENYLNLFIGVLCFCLASSSAYIINDLIDKKEDLLHPKKRKRPLASNSISIFLALIVCVLLMLSSLLLTIRYFNAISLLIILIYFFNSILYTFVTKHFAIFDAMSIALGFVLRVFFGIFCLATPISKWIIILTFTMCLFLAFIKRRKDFMTDGYLRESFKGYNLVMLDKFIVITSVLAIACYIMYTNEMVNINNNYGFTFTNLFVIFGVLRYLQALHLNVVDVGDSGIIIYKDSIFLANIVLWGLSLICCLIIS
jgi:decaprenyl-phosphate phosphoribosyltransferase